MPTISDISLFPQITDDVPIYILSSTLTEVEMRNLYFLSNYFVLPTRGEGWGLPIMVCRKGGGETEKEKGRIF